MRFFEKDKDTVVIKFFATIDYWFNNANQFTALFESLDARYKNIIIEAHCYGGHVFEGNVMYNSILNAKADVTIDIVGVSASMFSIVMLAGKKLRIADNAFIMIHTPSGFTDGNAAQHESAAKLLRKMEANFIKRYSEKTGKPVSEVKAWFDGTDHWFTAEEALEMGMADEIIPAVVKNVKDLKKPESPEDITALYGRYAALLKEEEIPTKSSLNSNLNIMNKKQLIENFQLEGVTEESSDTAVMEALKKKMGGNATPQASGTSNKVQAETVIATVEKITGKPFEAAQRKTLLTIGESSGLEVLAETIAMMSPGAKAEKPGDESEEGKTPAAPRIVSMTEDGSVSMDADRKKWDWDKWQKEDPDALSQMEDKNFKQFSDLYFAKYKKRPQQ